MTILALADLLWPRPRHVAAGGESWRPDGTVTLRLAAAGEVAETAASRLAAALAARGVEVRRAEATTGEGELSLDLDAGLPREGYRLAVAASGVRLTAGTAAGLAHGVSTLIQWLRLHGGNGPARLPALTVEDRPDFDRRGFLLDVSRDKVPKMETLLALVDLAAELKLNELQLYTEHTFAYRGHETVWQGASPLTAAEVRELDAYCHARAVELVPNQASFAHLHRWLRHEPYRGLAECPEGIEHPWSEEPEPFGLCPLDPGSLELLAGLYDQLLPCFASRRLNVGFDEPIDLGRGRSAAACAEWGVERVYLDFLLAVRRLAAERGRRIQCWGDTLIEHPELLAEVPGEVTFLEWGYEADHPFAERLARYAAAGNPFYVCPGTSSWNSFAGRTANALANLAAAARYGREAGAEGYLVTDWGDFGHLQPLPVSWPGLVAGAGYAWNTAAAAGDVPAETAHLARLLDAHVLRDRAGATGRVLLELGETYRVAGGRNRNGSSLFFSLVQPRKPLGEEAIASLEREGVEAALAHLAAVVAPLAGARMERSDAALVKDELTWVADALRLASRLALARLAAGRELPLPVLEVGRRKTLATDLEEILVRHRELWLARNRPGGLEDSAARLERVRRTLL